MPNPYRPSLFRVTLPLAAVVALGGLSACSSTPTTSPQQEFFETGSSPFSRTFSANSTQTCEAARRALLNQGYLATATRPDTIDATRDFQPSSDKHITVEFHVVCTPGDDPENTSIVYANAVQSGYALKKSDTSASVGFSLLGSVSLPIRSSSDSMVKVSSETIKAGTFYKQFFEYVAHYLHAAPKSPPGKAPVIKGSQLPGSSPAAETPPAVPAVAASASQPGAATPAIAPATAPAVSQTATTTVAATTTATPSAAAPAAAAVPAAAPGAVSTSSPTPATTATVAAAAATASALSSLPAPLVGPTKPDTVQPATGTAPPTAPPATAAQ